jgi:hypothetical protein
MGRGISQLQRCILMTAYRRYRDGSGREGGTRARLLDEQVAAGSPGWTDYDRGDIDDDTIFEQCCGCKTRPRRVVESAPCMRYERNAQGGWTMTGRVGEYTLRDSDYYVAYGAEINGARVSTARAIGRLVRRGLLRSANPWPYADSRLWPGPVLTCMGLDLASRLVAAQDGQPEPAPWADPCRIAYIERHIPDDDVYVFCQHHERLPQYEGLCEDVQAAIDRVRGDIGWTELPIRKQGWIRKKARAEERGEEWEYPPEPEPDAEEIERREQIGRDIWRSMLTKKAHSFAQDLTAEDRALFSEALLTAPPAERTPIERLQEALAGVEPDIG